jgi:hypothetical protein
LWELLTRTAYAGGKVRLPADLNVEVGAGCWLVTIRCHSEGCCATVPVMSLESLPVALEEALATDRVAWRPYETWKGRERAKPPQKKA